MIECQQIIPVPLQPIIFFYSVIEAFLEGLFGVEAVVVLLYTFQPYRLDSRVVFFIEELHSAQLLRCLVDEVCRPVVLSVS